MSLNIFREFHENHKFRDCCLGIGCEIGHRAVRKIVLCIACFAYSVTVTVIIIPSFVVLLNCLHLNP